MPAALPPARRPGGRHFLPALVALNAFAAWTVAARAADAASSAAAAARPALTVTLAQPQTRMLTNRIAANGNVAAWHEAVIGTETSGLRLAEVRANVGDTVRRGELLARFDDDTLRADLAQLRAAVGEAEALLAEAAANAGRARELRPQGMISAQQFTQAITAERTAEARLAAQRAAQRAQELRLANTRVLAPDAGIVSARGATVGAVPAPGAELFRLIRQGRLEWRAEVPAAELARIRPGLAARVGPGEGVPGRVRVVAPTVDPATRNGIVYVDLPAPGALKAGMFARGTFDLGASPALTLPASAVLLRDGFHVVLRVGSDSRVTSVKVEVGRREGDRIEIGSGLPADARVVASGGAFLGDGDLVRVVDAAAAPASAAGR